MGKKLPGLKRHASTTTDGAAPAATAPAATPPVKAATPPPVKTEPAAPPAPSTPPPAPRRKTPRAAKVTAGAGTPASAGAALPPLPRAPAAAARSAPADGQGPPDPPASPEVPSTPAESAPETAPDATPGPEGGSSKADEAAVVETAAAGTQDAAAPASRDSPEASASTPDGVLSRGRSAEARRIVERHGRLAIAGGALPLPLVDIAAVAAIQVRMLRRLAAHYDADLSEEKARSTVMTLMGSVTPHAVGGAARWLAGPALPVVGWLGAMAGGGATARATTRVMGDLFVEHFERGTPLAAG